MKQANIHCFANIVMKRNTVLQNKNSFEEKTLFTLQIKNNCNAKKCHICTTLLYYNCIKDNCCWLKIERSKTRRHVVGVWQYYSSLSYSSNTMPKKTTICLANGLFFMIEIVFGLAIFYIHLMKMFIIYHVFISKKNNLYFETVVCGWVLKE